MFVRPTRKATLSCKRPWPVALLVALVVFASTTATGSAQTVADIELRDNLIADQANLLNAYRCLFYVDTEIVPGGCNGRSPAGPRAVPDPFTGTPTQQGLTTRDQLVADQEALLNDYRCLFDVDTEIVPGG